MSGPTVGYATLQIIPSTKGILQNLRGELDGPLATAGGAAGDRTAKTFGTRFTSGIKTAAKVGAVAFGAAFAGAVVIGKQSIEAASSLEQALGKTDAVFGESAEEIKAWAATASTAFGQSQSQALAAASTYGNLFQAFGIGQRPAQDMSQTLVELAADLAAFNDTSVDEALLALRSGLSGETEPLKRFGVALNDARLKEQALALGIWDGVGALDAAQKAQAAYAVIMNDTSLAQGAFGREADSLSARQMTLAAGWEDLKARIGTALLPALSSLVAGLNSEVIPALSRLADEWGPKVRDMFEAVAAAVREHWPAVRDTIATVVTWFQGTAWPVISKVAGFVIARFAEIVAAVRRNWPQIRETIAGAIEAVRVIIDTTLTVIRAVWDKFGEHIVAVIQNRWDTIKAVVQAALDIVRGVINTVTALIRGDWSGAWDGIKTVLSGAWDGIKAIVSGALTELKLLIGAAWLAIRLAAQAAWDWVGTKIVATWDALVSFMGTIPDRMLGALGDMVQWGKDLVAAIVSGIKAAAGAITNAIKDAVPSPGDLVKGVAGGIGGAVKSVIPGLASGGFASPGWTGLVGEEGPELMHVTASGAAVLSHSNTRQALASTGPKISIGEVHNHNDVDVQAFWQRSNALLAVA